MKIFVLWWSCSQSSANEQLEALLAKSSAHFLKMLGKLYERCWSAPWPMGTMLWIPGVRYPWYLGGMVVIFLFFKENQRKWKEKHVLYVVKEGQKYSIWFLPYMEKSSLFCSACFQAYDIWPTYVMKWFSSFKRILESKVYLRKLINCLKTECRAVVPNGKPVGITLPMNTCFFSHLLLLELSKIS